MNRKPVSRRFLTPMVAIALVLTIGLAVVLVAARVVAKLGDATGASVLDSVALAMGLFWLIDVVCLVLALGVNALESSSGSPPDELE
ncbi:MAG: hypothetical protein JW818_23095 [Pirellulales bacterium]|nr:hypothetical protein [Pirellulales bacterium]